MGGKASFIGNRWDAFFRRCGTKICFNEIAQNINVKMQLNEPRYEWQSGMIYALLKEVGDLNPLKDNIFLIK